MSTWLTDRAKAGTSRDGTVDAGDLGHVSERVARTLVVAPELVEGALRDGRRAGYKDGYSSGYADGLAEARLRTVDLADRLLGLVPKLEEVITSLHSGDETARIDIQDQVVSVSLISQALLGHQIEGPREPSPDR
jgi:hypothetical protein